MSHRQSRRKTRQSERKEKTAPQLAEIQPKTANQKKYFKSIRQNPYSFVVGPPGTGKTFIALWHGIKAVLDPRSPIEKIVVIRPLVEVKNFDEAKMGALPGDAKQKMAPWMGGMMDSMREVMYENDVYKMLRNIDFFNMALCRGRSFTNTFVIIDEAQNITVEGDGMKMLLTRLGRDSKMVIAGDLKQSDLGTHKASAMRDAIRKFCTEPGFGVTLLEPGDIQRNSHISRILELYGDYNPNEPAVSLEDILKEKN